MANASADNVVTFDLLGEVMMDGQDILSKLTEEEQSEVHKVVTLLESAQEDSLKDFENDTNLLRHKPIDNCELDRLAGKNNALSTTYQTKWAVAVAKGNI